jgi:hypothetical protein
VQKQRSVEGTARAAGVASAAALEAAANDACFCTAVERAERSSQCCVQERINAQPRAAT